MRVAPFACQPVARLADDRHAVGVTGKDKDRDERLAAALRENLKRRKEQTRGDPPAAPTKPDDADRGDA